MKILDIRTDGGTQPRKELDYELISEFLESINNGDKFPAVIVFYDGTDNWLADGFHRLKAFKRAGKEEIESETIHGTRRDAVLYSVGANAEHGKRRSNEDKRRAVMTLLNDDEWSQWSNKEIARRCKVSDMTVHRIKKSIPLSSTSCRCDQPTERKVKRGNTVYTQKTENIGKNQTVSEKPKTQYNAEEKQAIKNGYVIDSKMFARSAIAQIERIEKEDPTAIESLLMIRDFIDKTIQEWG